MRLWLSLLLMLPSCSVRSAAAGTVSPTPNPDALYREAIGNLKAGHGYQDACEQLRYLVGQDKGNRGYHLALGCADADRAASLAYAALWTQMLDNDRKRYPEDLRDWQAAQNDPKDDNYGASRPDLPPLRTFVTKDDSHPFLMSTSEAVTQINTLVAEAQREWREAQKLSQTDAERAETEYVQGWGMGLLRLVSAKNLLGDNDHGLSGLGAVPKTAEILTALRAAAHDAPTNAAYWQSLGDAQTRNTSSDKPSDKIKTLVFYKKALALQPNNPALWFRIYQSYYPYGNNPPYPIQEALQHVIESDPNNAYPHYLLAGLLFRATHYNDPHDQTETSDKEKALTANYDKAQQQAANKALEQIEEGNSALQYTELQYSPPFPDLLSTFVIWEANSNVFVDARPFQEYANLRELTRAAGGYARIAAAHGDEQGLERGARAAIGMGLKLAGHWPIADQDPNDHGVLSVLIGGSIAAIGYGDLVKGYQQVGDIPAAAQAQQEFQAFQERRKAWSAALGQQPSTDYDSY